MTKTAVGLFDSSGVTDKVVADLLHSGFSRDEVKLVRRSDFEAKPSPDTDILKIGGVPPEHAGPYWDAVRSGRELVAVTAESDRAEHAAQIMDQDGAVGVKETAAATPVAGGDPELESDDPGFFPHRSAAQLFVVS
jgi:hypothetical protein